MVKDEKVFEIKESVRKQVEKVLEDYKGKYYVLCYSERYDTVREDYKSMCYPGGEYLFKGDWLIKKLNYEDGTIETWLHLHIYEDENSETYCYDNKGNETFYKSKKIS